MLSSALSSELLCAVASRNRAGIIPLCSALVRSHLASGQLWVPQLREAIELLEQAQRRAAELVKGWSTGLMRSS